MTYDADDMHAGWSEAVTRALRDIYAPPAAPEYWDALERRIMDRIEGDVAPWWTVMGRWTHVGAAAAAVALLAAGLATTLATRDAEARFAYESVLGDTISTSAYDRATRTAGLSVVDASFQYVIPR
jgi:anti-sigma-K factor RskA